MAFHRCQVEKTQLPLASWHGRRWQAECPDCDFALFADTWYLAMGHARHHYAKRNPEVSRVRAR